MTSFCARHSTCTKLQVEKLYLNEHSIYNSLGETRQSEFSASTSLAETPSTRHQYTGARHGLFVFYNIDNPFTIIYSTSIEMVYTCIHIVLLLSKLFRKKVLDSSTITISLFLLW